MEKDLIEALKLVSEILTKEVRQKEEWGHFGNSYGHSESKKRLELCAEILMAVTYQLY